MLRIWKNSGEKNYGRGVYRCCNFTQFSAQNCLPSVVLVLAWNSLGHVFTNVIPVKCLVDMPEVLEDNPTESVVQQFH